MPHTAEEHLAITTDTQNLRKGLRASHPQAQWVKVFKSTWAAEDYEAIHDGWGWTLSAARTALRLAGAGVPDAGNKALAEHCSNVSDTVCPGAGLLQRLEHFAGTTKAILGRLPEEVARPEGRHEAEDPGGQQGSTWLGDLEDMVEQLTQEIEEADRAKGRTDAGYWKAWRQRALATGGRQMHKACKTRPGWTPPHLGRE